MKKINLTILIILLITAYSQLFAQDDGASQKLILFETQLNLLKQQIGDSNINDLYAQLEQLKQQTDTNNEEKIAIIKAELETKEQQLKELQKSVTDLTTQITQLNSVLTTQNEAKKNAEKLQKIAQETQDKVTQQTLGKFKSDVKNFAGFGTLLDAIASTATGLLLFPESKNKEPFTVSLGKYVGIAGGMIGPIIYGTGNDNNSQQKVGVITTGLSLSLTGLLTTVFKKDKNTQTLIENVARNRGFTDEVSSFSKSSLSFKYKSKELYEKIKEFEDNVEWKPTESQLNEYYVIITLRRDLAVVLRQMQAKAIYLRDFETLTEEGKNKLNELIAKYKEALETWEGQEATFISTYNYLKNLK